MAGNDLKHRVHSLPHLAKVVFQQNAQIRLRHRVAYDDEVSHGETWIALCGLPIGAWLMMGMGRHLQIESLVSKLVIWLKRHPVACGQMARDDS